MLRISPQAVVCRGRSLRQGCGYIGPFPVLLFLSFPITHLHLSIPGL